MLNSLLTPWRLRVYPTAALVGITLGFLVFVSTGDGLRSIRGGRIGGDFPAFYAAGELLSKGNPKAIYSPESMRSTQRPLLPDIDDGWLTFAYPPYVAVAYVPLAQLPFKAAYVVHTALMTMSCILALWLLRPVCPLLAHHFVPCVAATLTFYPVFRANVGGQNTAISLLCAAGAAAALAGGRQKSAGLWLAAWLFKPQLALPAICAVLLAGYRKTLPTLAAGALAWYAIGAAIAGVTWPLWWIQDVITPFASEDLIVDRGRGISFREWTSEIGASNLGLVLTIVTGLYVARALWRQPVSDRPLPVTAAGASAAVLTAPHAMFYEGGLGALAAFAAASSRGSIVPSQAIGLWLLGLAQIFRAFVPMPPLTLVMIFAVLLSVRSLQSPTTDAIATSGRE